MTWTESLHNFELRFRRHDHSRQSSLLPTLEIPMNNENKIITRDPNGTFWCDNFDCDLFRAVPESREILEELGQVKLLTRGTVTNGRLNHPTCWNHDKGLIALFSFSGEPRPPGYHSSDPIVECTFEEAIRDAWVHTLVVVVERQLIWNAFELRREFETLMYHHRKWRVDEPAAAKAARRVAATLLVAELAFQEICHSCEALPKERSARCNS
jgi:hypothetical protein